MRKIVFLLITFLLLGMLGLLFWGLYFSSDPKEIPSALIGKKAHNFKFETFSGSTVELKHFLGKPIVLNFWASWCVACRKEASLLEQAYQEYRQKGVTFIGIAINDEKKKALRFASKHGKTYLLGLDDELGSIAIEYGVTAVPETFFIDRHGVIKKKILGELNEAKLYSFLKGRN